LLSLKAKELNMVEEIKKIISTVALEYPIRSIDVFGSYANNEVHDNSDIDLLIYFDEKRATLFDLIGIKIDLEALLHKKIDIVAGPLKKDSYLYIKKKIRIYEA
jgi:uncharacterized protein